MPALLFITSPDINMGEDILHEGLDSLLGPERVHCYPFKDYAAFQYNLYPPTADHVPHRRPVGIARLIEHKSDIAGVVLTTRRPAPQTWAQIRGYFPEVPVAMVNGEEEGSRLIFPPDLGCTHRFQWDLLPTEAQAGLYPMAMAAPERVMLAEETIRDIDVSYVVRNTNQLRLEVARVLEREGFLVLVDADIPREQFCWILNRSKIAVSVRGAGVDTFRYWEIPYHGALLASSRPPTLIPDNFVDGESAVFFDEPGELVVKVRALLADKTRLSRIAAAGKKLSHSKHTAAARARYLLETMGLGGLIEPSGDAGAAAPPPAPFPPGWSAKQ
jgi:hypothetical protein